MAPVFDYPGTLRRFGNDHTLFREMAQITLDDAPKWVDLIRDGLATGNKADVQRAAHSIKGMVSSFGAAGAQAAALQIEQHAGMGNLHAAAATLPLLEDALNALSSALQQQIHEESMTKSSAR
jgi:two-component system sensor histidine kinase/response regulator